MNTDLLAARSRLVESTAVVGRASCEQWRGAEVGELDEVLRELETVAREVQAAACVVAAERSRVEEGRGRTVGTCAPEQEGGSGLAGPKFA